MAKMVEYIAAAVHAFMGISHIMEEEYVFGICYLVLAICLCVYCNSYKESFKDFKKRISDLGHTVGFHNDLIKIARNESTQPVQNA